MSSTLTLAACLTVFAPTESSAAPDPAAALADADELEQRGRYPAAARRIETVLPAFEQDYGLRLRAAWLRFEAGHWRRAQRHYVRAIELSQGSLDSRLGLGWSLLRDGQRRAALTTFEDLERDFPEVPAVAAALAQARERPVVVPRGWVWLTGQLHPRHPTLRRGLGGQLGLGLTLAEHGLLSVGYGYARLGYEPTDEALALTAATGAGPGGSGSGNGGGSPDGGDVGSDEPPASDGPGPGGSTGGNVGPGYGRGTADDPFLGNTIAQHQLHAAAGVTWPAAGVLIQYGWLHDQGLPAVHAVGTSARVSPWGDIVLDASATVEPGVVRPRLAAHWRLPVHRHVWLRPGGSMQVDGSEILGTGRLTVGLHGEPGSVWLGGMAGRERRPALLDVPLILNLADDLRWGAWAGGLLPLPRGFALLLGYEVYGLDPLDPTVPWATAHYITAGMTWTRPPTERR
ncbi:MAG: tetratricopeptide repeat protein [Nannocystaceae bacterium]